MKSASALGIALAWLTASVHADSFYSLIEKCPQSCLVAGSEPANWTYYHDLDSFKYCNKTTLFDLALYSPVNDPDTHTVLRACAASEDGSVVSRREFYTRQLLTGNSTKETLQFACNAAGGAADNVDVDVHLSSGGSGDATSDQVAAAVKSLAEYVDQASNCEPTVLLAQNGNVVAGVYIGSQFEKQSVTTLIEKFADASKTSANSRNSFAQICSGKAVGSQVFGIFVDTTRNISSVQEALRGWSDAECLNDLDSSGIWSKTNVGLVSAVNEHEFSNSHGEKRSGYGLERRDTCKYVQAVANDGCWSLAQKCGISQDDLTKYNSASNFCNTVQAGQYVCCSAGSLPDFSPQPNSDGSCFSYTIQNNDLCSTIAEAHQMKADKIEDVNKNTWGWGGCNDLMPGQIICLSSGDPPMPAPVSNAICGPQVPGTKKPTDGTKLADLNPCPLNSCCDVWGQCGITPDFCTPTPADTGAPGTARPNTNGCISNCGTNITNNDKGPASFARVGYFEAWNLDRPCLHMDISKFKDDNYYTHVHFAFGGITSDYKVNISGVETQFEGLKALTNVKRILSFGGWSFSTEADTFPIFRQGVSDANRQAFAKDVAQFAVDNNLDGVDFDWEYPGAPDIKGIPPGDPGDGDRYLQFLKLVRAALPSDKSLSIAAPASYWYLKGFPIKEISDVVDYIIYMTYDLHGQWDYDNAFANPGCPTGNCLRSHVNITETDYALAMITKAGVPSTKVMVGMARYGRSFQMAEVGCSTEDCKFTEQGATPGPCTNTSGYISNVEIQSIIAQSLNPDLYNTSIQQFFNEGDILVYDDDQWVSYLSSKSYGQLSDKWMRLNFGGTSDWAVDLEEDYGGSDGTGDQLYQDMGSEPFCDYTLTFDSLSDLAAASGSYDATCNAIYATQVLSDLLVATWANYTSVDDGYDAEWKYYVEYVNDMIQPGIDQFMIDKKTGLAGEGMKYFNCGDSDSESGTELCYDWITAHPDQFVGGSYNLYMTLKDSDGFYGAILDKYGIEKDWIDLTSSKDDSVACLGPSGTPCPVNAGTRIWYHYPLKAKDITVSNPKDLVTKTIGNINALKVNITATYQDMVLNGWYGAFDDVAQVLSVPVFMLAEAVDAMAQVKQLAEQQKKIDEEAKKNFILSIIGVVLMFIPFAEEAAAAVGLARIASLAGATADAAFGIYTIVDNPNSDFMTFMTALMGAGSVASAARNVAGFKKLAGMRAAIAAGDIAKIGKVFKERDDMLQTIINVCKR